MGLALATAVLAGCEARPGLLPNKDASLRRPTAVIRADGAQRIYPSEAPRLKGLAARSQIGYMAKTVEVANLSTDEWENVEVWVNGQYVVYLPRIERGVLKSIPWDALYDREGKHLPKDSRTFVVNTVEVFMGGSLYDVPVTVAY